jgi:IS4 transposase
MVYAQLCGASSLRQLEAGFNAQYTHHYHLGTRAVRRTTLADANARRSPEVFAAAARVLMTQASRTLRREADELLYLLDSSSITLKGPGFDDWTRAKRTRNTQGLKLHLLYDAQTQLPVWQHMSAPRLNDIEAARQLPLETDAIYVFDKGYCDYHWWARLNQQGARFVTRFKRNAALRVIRERPIVPELAGQILADQIVCLSNPRPGGGRRNPYTQPLRRILVARPDQPTPLVLATNDLKSEAGLIAQRYKARWQIELYFKWIKQHLRIKQFMGRSENAVRIQILTALISYLLLALYRQAQGFKLSLWQCLGELRASLFQRPSTDAELYRRRRQRQQAFDLCQPGLFA